jgi:hypothetical protein
MAYSVEEKAASMIRQLQKKLKPRAGRRISSADKGRIKARIARLRAESQTAQSKRAHAKPAKPKRAQGSRSLKKLTKPLDSRGENKMSRKGYGARKLTQAEGRAEMAKSPKSPARTAQIKRSQAAAGTPTVKGKRPLQRVQRGRPGASKSLFRMPPRRFRVQK